MAVGSPRCKCRKVTTPEYLLPKWWTSMVEYWLLVMVETHTLMSKCRKAIMSKCWLLVPEGAERLPRLNISY